MAYRPENLVHGAQRRPDCLVSTQNSQAICQCARPARSASEDVPSATTTSKSLSNDGCRESQLDSSIPEQVPRACGADTQPRWRVPGVPVPPRRTTFYVQFAQTDLGIVWHVLGFESRLVLPVDALLATVCQPLAGALWRSLRTLQRQGHIGRAREGEAEARVS